MALITKQEVKALLQITVSTYDTLIDRLYPIVRNYIVYDLLQNKFKDPLVWVESSALSFMESDGSINDSLLSFIYMRFSNYDDIIVEGSLLNDGLYTIAEDGLTAGKLTLDFSIAPPETLKDEPSGLRIITITKVRYPLGLKIPVSELYGHILSKQSGSNINSESTGSYSVTYFSGMPKSILQKFDKYKKLSW